MFILEDSQSIFFSSHLRKDGDGLGSVDRRLWRWILLKKATPSSYSLLACHGFIFANALWETMRWTLDDNPMNPK